MGPAEQQNQEQQVDHVLDQFARQTYGGARFAEENQAYKEREEETLKKLALLRSTNERLGAELGEIQGVVADAITDIDTWRNDLITAVDVEGVDVRPIEAIRSKFAQSLSGDVLQDHRHRRAAIFEARTAVQAGLQHIARGCSPGSGVVDFTAAVQLSLETAESALLKL